METRWAFAVCHYRCSSLPIITVLVLWTLLYLKNPFVFALDLDPQDRASLTAFKSQLNDPTRSLSTWDGSNCTNWTGVLCDIYSGRVISMNLSHMNLSGTVSPSLCKLSFLQILVLSHNNFNSMIPSCLGNLLSLRTLDLSYNGLGGSVPNTLMRLLHLRELILNDNPYLGGNLPVWVGNFSTNLRKLNLGSDSFQGEIPQSLFYSKSLEYLDVSNNNLSGSLLEFHQPLVLLNLASNQIFGTLPCFDACVQSLSILNLANNFIVGQIPSCISSLQALRQLNLSNNGLKYQISPMLVFSEKLLALDLSYNALSGPIPRKIAETTYDSGLLILDLSHNQFSGEIPSKITELKSLQALFLSHNLLSGEIPAMIGNLTYLQVIDLSHNSLTGSIPLNIVGCFQLLALILNNNNLSGEIQPELDALDGLRILDISFNKISGEIPLTLAGCRSLEVVDFSSNNLLGPLNDAMTKWPNLRFLSLASNYLDGSLSGWLFTFPAMRTIDLSGNNFSGYIPDGNFNVSSDFNNATIARSNTTAGEQIAASVKVSVMLLDIEEVTFAYDLASAIGIDLSSNQLIGEIPVGLFSLWGLEYLNLSNNFLDGKILSGLDKMTNLRALDLSHNSLSGPVPPNISSLRELAQLNLSYNCFSGFVSTKEGYWRFPGAFAGNPDLCIEVSDGKCQQSALPKLPEEKFGDDSEDGPISVWIFCVSAAVTFYSTIIALFCSSQSRNYILRTKT
ncbi:hypothetical protein Nepgr_001766 [Nepenthes gracilis]|uniref:Leucine-rich repeat-containing N-terminal plant-type domain-containing protein n=1 Tax=Nepenthes gracilis TaxID=150966 RepID=A0AAD3RWA3_NEPGR|nr:hypothetical protein Nepgr_001766 [Nepenthes gracilis]